MFDIFIIGGGPAGLTAAVYATRAGYKTALAEKSFCGGQMAETSKIENYSGFMSISGYELAEKMEQQVRNTNTEIIAKSARDIYDDGQIKRIITEDGSEYSARAVILCMGAGKRMLGCEGEREFIGKGVSYCATCDGNFFKGKDTAVVGGGNTALDDALYLSKICRQVVLIHRRSDFGGSEILQERVRQAENIKLVTDSEVQRIFGDTAVGGITVNNVKSGKTEEIPVNGVFCAVGTVPNSESVRKIVKTDEKGYITADESCETSAAGIFAAGDIRTKRLRQIITAAADGANAVNSAQKYLNKRKD